MQLRSARLLAVAAMTVAGVAVAAIPAGASLTPTAASASSAAAPAAATASPSASPSSAAVVAPVVAPSPGTAVKRQPTYKASGWKPACVTKLRAHAACLVLVDQGVAEPFTHGTSVTVNPAGFGSVDLRSAYNLPAGGAGQTVAIVDAYDNPNAESDLATYRAQYGLPACTTANGCFDKVGQDGTSSYPAVDPTGGWEIEESLDVDMVSAICPLCHIDLVEANSSGLLDLGESVDTAVGLGAKFVSNSYGAGDFSGEHDYDSFYYHDGDVITASAGDLGYGVNYPAASLFVTAVGGTSLTHSVGGRGWTETAWGSSSGGDGTGAGCSAYEVKPPWQTDSGCANRTVGDVSAVADPNTGVAIYDTYPDNLGISGWGVVGGTSAASPIIASVYALAGAPTSGTFPVEYLYQQHNAADLNDVTTGADGTCSPAYLCTAGAGYDGPTGWGTPQGVAAFQAPGSIPTGAVTSGISRKCLDDYLSGGGNLNVIDIYGCNSTKAQIWGVEANSTIRDVANDRCMDAYRSGNTNGTLVELYQCNGTGAQVWHASAGELVNPESGKCLTGPASGANGTQLVLETCTGATGQLWTLPS